MFRNITREKVEEVIALAERARLSADERADTPRRGGHDGDRALRRADQPLSPQPAPDWAHALPRYLGDLPDAALTELAALYAQGRDAPPPPAGAADLASELAARPDLSDSLRRALSQL